MPDDKELHQVMLNSVLFFIVAEINGLVTLIYKY